MAASMTEQDFEIIIPASPMNSSGVLNSRYRLCIHYWLILWLNTWVKSFKRVIVLFKLTANEFWMNSVTRYCPIIILIFISKYVTHVMFTVFYFYTHWEAHRVLRTHINFFNAFIYSLFSHFSFKFNGKWVFHWKSQMVRYSIWWSLWW